jgi:hypothetical protein
MNLWSVRSQALVELQGNLKQEKEVLEEGFALLDECVDRLYSCTMIDNDNTRLAAVCCQSVVKARRLALGCYSLILDGLVLEAGALMRILKEPWQLLIYLHGQPERVESVLSDKPPRAGDIAGAINREFHNQLQGLTDYYNKYVSHISFQEEALVPITMVFNSESLKTDMHSLFSVIANILCEAVMPCLVIVGNMDNALAERIKSFSYQGLEVIGNDEQHE